MTAIVPNTGGGRRRKQGKTGKVKGVCSRAWLVSDWSALRLNLTVSPRTGLQSFATSLL
jgi:hypothetical protein